MPLIAGLESPVHALVTGASSGIGLAAVAALLQRSDLARVVAVARHAVAAPALAELAAVHGDRILRVDADLTRQTDRQRLAETVQGDTGSLHLLFNAAGLLHDEGLQPEKSLAQLNEDALQRSFALNAFAPILLVQALLPLFEARQPGVIASVSARVGSIADNALGGWYSYRAAKAAQNQLMRTLAVELKRSHSKLTVLQLHPGTVDTPLSAPFKARVPAGKLFSAEQSANLLLQVIEASSAADSGRFFAYDGTEIPW
ncbi:MAG: SDR family NAD(P)-dependent oxidoreductase [Aquimonas sp.]|jgi:NAD(P)-dependent dehydrogenase (short-subunit alcohol dehydrogenase family)